MLKIVTVELDRMAKMLQSSGENFETIMKDTLEMVEEMAREGLIKRTPVKSGALLDSWRYEIEGMELEVYSPLDYAVHVEEGHDNYRGVVRGYWEGDQFIYDPTCSTSTYFGELFIDGVGMLRFTFEDIKGELGDLLKTAMEKMMVW